MKKNKKIEERVIRPERECYDDLELHEIEQAEGHTDPDVVLDMMEVSEDAWNEIESRLDEVTGTEIRYNVARVNADKWLEASKAMATEAKAIAEKATSRKELFRIDAIVDMFDREIKKANINIQPCRLHCQNAIRDAYARLS